MLTFWPKVQNEPYFFFNKGVPIRGLGAGGVCGGWWWVNSQIVPIFLGATPYKELKTRIDKYLKENKKEKIIEPEKLMSSLRTSYPEGF